MQEFQSSIPGLSGRMFGGAGPSDLRRAHHHQQGARCGGGVPPEAVKCPRCESTNTKFCYYNNYNLSQPRHFCKSCRRYWTKGGVLRNVPVGGGCRKAKRPSSSSTPTSTTEAKNPRRALASSPRSTNSGSTSPSAPAAVPSSSNNIAIVTGHRSTTPISSTGVDVAPPAPIFADQAVALASLFAPPPPPPPPLPVFSFAAQQPKDEAARPDADMAAFTSLDVGIFEQFGDASAAAYWNAVGCWTDDVQDLSVYLP
jgi:hypothetical protein